MTRRRSTEVPKESSSFPHKKMGNSTSTQTIRRERKRWDNGMFLTLNSGVWSEVDT